MSNNKKIICAEGYEAFLLAYIKDLYEMDAPMIAGAVEECLKKFRSFPALDVIPRAEYESTKANCESWKDAFAESNEKATLDAQRSEAVVRENRRMRAIIIQHLPGDTVCQHCKYFEQCKHEALDDADAQTESRFWSCDGYSHFAVGDFVGKEAPIREPLCRL